MKSKEMVRPGYYVVAVSGGVDSMTLLDMLRQQPQVRLIVAHFDHGIRPDSNKDRQLVEDYCAAHNLAFVYREGRLGAQASELVARRARYAFLQEVRLNYGADAIVTAHHQDDVLETALINLLRGTGRRGLDSLSSHPHLIRPLLSKTKQEIEQYAKQQGVAWREDVTNQDTKYLRNFVRHVLLSRADKATREQLYQIIVRQRKLNAIINSKLDRWLDEHGERQATTSFALPRYDLIMTPSAVAYELLQHAFKRLSSNTLERPQAERALMFCKTGRIHKHFHLNTTWQLTASKKRIVIELR